MTRSKGSFRCALLAAVPLFLAACGGGSHDSSPTTTETAVSGTSFTLKQVQSCLDDAGLHAFRNQNKVVNGSGGELRVDFGYGKQWIYIAFGRNAQEALSIQNKAVAVTLTHNPQLGRQTVLAGVRVRDNVFYYSDGGPVSIVEGRQVDRCLT